LEFKIESRIPLALFRKAPFIYSGPDFVSFPLGMISNIINYHGRSLQRFYPLTISKVAPDSLLIDKMFCFSFFYVNDEDNLILFLTHPYWFDRSNIKKVFDFFLTKVEELARFANSEFIQVEFHEKSNPTIAFPTSLSHFSYDLSNMQIQKRDLSLFQQHGFYEERAILCYEQSIREVEKKEREGDHTCNSYTISSINQSKFAVMEKSIREFPIKAYTLSTKDPIMNQRMPYFFNATVSAAHKRSKWFLRKSLDGFLQWSPNLLELFRKYRSPVPFLFYYTFKSYPFKYGKIFNWALRVEDTRLFSCLLFHVLHIMKQKGLEVCQVAQINNEQTFMKTVLESYGFKMVHTIKLLRKKVR